MIFKCSSCKKYSFWNKNCYKVIGLNENQEEVSEIKMCQPCGEEVDRIYNEGKVIMELGDKIE